MQKLIRYARGAFWVIGVIELCLGSLFFVVTTLGLIFMMRARNRWGLYVELAIALLIIGIGGLSCMAGSAWKKRSELALPLVAINSLLSLLVIPFGTVAGAAGLYWCASKRLRDEEAALPPPLPRKLPNWIRQAIPYAQGLFVTVGLAGVLIGVLESYQALVHPHHSHKSGFLTTPLGGVLLFGLGMIGPGVLSLLAAWAWKNKKPFAKPLVAINSVLNLIFIPFGTLAGIVGLAWCWAGDAEADTAAAAEFKHKARPGDGTNDWVQKLVPVLSIAAWLVTFGIVRRWGAAHHMPRAPINIIVLLVLCEWITTFLHELGHTVAAWTVEMAVNQFTVGPFAARKRGGEWRVEFSLMGVLTSGGGAMSSMPLHLRDLRKRMAVEIAGGPVASLLTALGAFALLQAAPGSSWEKWWMVPAMTGAIAAYGLVLNLIPFAVATGFSDGAALIQILKGGAFCDLRAAVKAVGATTVTELRPRDVDGQALEHGLRASVGKPEEGTLRILQVICALDRGDWAVARRQLDASLEWISVPAKAPNPALAVEMALYIALLDGNAERAGKWFDDSVAFAARQKVSLEGEFDYWVSAAAVYQARGEQAEFERAFARAVKMSERRPRFGLYEFERDLLETLRVGEWLEEAPRAA